MIHDTAIISKNAEIGSNVSVGPFTVIHDGVYIGSGTEIGSHCELGVNSGLATQGKLVISSNSIIRSHSVIYLGSAFGEELITGHRVTIRENTVAGKNLQVGTLSDIQGDCQIGDYVRFHSNVHIGKGSHIGDFVWIFPYVVLTNDPHPPSEVRLGVKIHDFSVIATMSTLLPGVEIGRGALVAAHSLVNRNVEAEMIVAGVPAKPLGPTHKIKLFNLPDTPAYPWNSHFSRGYPDEVVKEWRNSKED